MPIGVPQGSILGPLLFLIYVNDLPDCHLASDILYADDTVLYYSSKSVSDLEHHINGDLGTVSEWFSRNLLSLSVVFSVDSVDLSQCDAAANKFVCYHTSYMNRTVGNRILRHMSNSWTAACMISANVERLDCRSY